VRKAVGSLERDEFTVIVLASDLQGLENLWAGEPADARRPFAGPIHARIASLECRPGGLLEMDSHGFEYRQRVGVGEQDLESVAGHDDQVEALVRLVGLRRGFDPFNLFRVGFASGHSQHRRCGIDTGHMVTAFGEGTAERARAATQVEDTAWARSGEGEVKVGILRPRVCQVVNLCDPSVLIVHDVPHCRDPRAIL